MIIALFKVQEKKIEVRFLAYLCYLMMCPDLPTLTFKGLSFKWKVVELAF